MRRVVASIVLGFAACTFSLSAIAADAALKLPEKKQTKLGLYMSAKEALETKQANPGKVLFVDIRTPEEYEFVGHPVIADANVPYLKVDYAAWDEKKSLYAQFVNERFDAGMEKLLKANNLDKTATVILMCRSGDRSALAADQLAKAGYTKVYSVYEGFEGDMAKGGDNDGKRAVNGWKNAGLPWTYTMEKTKAYME